MDIFFTWKYIKEFLLDIAEVIDAFRAVPRTILIVYGLLIWEIYSWITTLPEITTQAASILGAVLGIASVIIGFYNSTGRKWQDENRSNWFLEKLKRKDKDDVVDKDS